MKQLDTDWPKLLSEFQADPRAEATAWMSLLLNPMSERMLPMSFTASPKMVWRAEAISEAASPMSLRICAAAAAASPKMLWRAPAISEVS